MTRIVLLHGQNHKGSTYHIGRMIADRLGQESEITEFFLPRELPHFCNGCYGCIVSEESCPYYEEKHRILAAMEEADVLIFTTPTYCLRASAPMKSFIDLTFSYWMSHRPRACMFRKKAVVVSTAAGTGAGSACKDIATMLRYWGVPYIKTYGISVQAMSWEQVSEKKKTKIERDTERLAEKLERKKLVRAGWKTKGLFAMMRVMQKAGMGSGPDDRQYWEDRGWLGKARPWK